MDWLPDILKNLNKLRLLVAAVFVTTVIMHFGPILIPAYIPKLSSQLVPYFFPTMLLTGALLFFWGLTSFWNFSTASARKTIRTLRSLSLSDSETTLLFLMAKDPSQPFNLNNIDYSRIPVTKLEFHYWAKQLKNKGLAQILLFDDNFISLTERGRERALKIQRQLAQNSK